MPESDFAERQALAFRLLRDEARTAHAEGDGLKVSLLCETATDEIRRLQKKSRLALALTEIQWAFILQFYWMRDWYAVSKTSEILESIEDPGPADSRIREILRAHAWIILQPLEKEEAVLARLRKLDPTGFGSEAAVETLELARHLLELAWVRVTPRRQWEELADLWMKNGPSWLESVLQPTLDRLRTQTPLVASGPEVPVLPPDGTSSLRPVSDLAELWLLSLHGHRSAAVARIEEISPHVQADSYRWRQASDLWHLNRSVSPNDDESQAVWLARRRKMTPDFPLLVFYDHRAERIAELLAELCRRNEVGAAHERWVALQLAVLHELAALRHWDFGMWVNAIEAQSQVFLDACRWDDANGAWFGATGLTLGVRGMQLRDPAKDKWSAAGLRALEFAPRELLDAFFGRLFSMYPRQNFRVFQILASAGDLVRLEQWEQMAMWTLAFARANREHKTDGMTANVMKPWTHLLHSVSSDSAVWAILQPEVVVIAAAPHLWQSNDSQAVLHTWIQRAPTDLVKEAAETMLAVPSQDAGTSGRRTELLLLTEGREDLRGTFAQRILAAMTHPAVRLKVLQRLKDAGAGAMEASLRARLREAIPRMLDAAIIPEGQAKFSPPAYPAGVEDVESWAREDSGLLDRLIISADAPRILREYLPWILGTIQLMVANGPADFARRAQAEVRRWSERPPCGFSPSAKFKGPFATFQWHDIGLGFIQTSVGWIAFQVWRRMGDVSRTDLLAWIQAVLVSGETAPLSAAFHFATVLVSSLSPEEARTIWPIIESILVALRARASDSSEATTALTEALDCFSGTVCAARNELADWTTRHGASALENLEALLIRHMPAVAAVPDPALRAAVARVLSNMARWRPLGPTLEEVLSRLSHDNRARVRRAATVGPRD